MLAAGSAQAVSTLAAGDIAIVAFNSDDPDSFAWVALADIDAGTQIHFTDASWQGGSFRATELGTPYTWTASAALSAGSVVTINSSSAFNFSGAGDQIFAYQGSGAFLYGIDFANTGWTPSATIANSTNESNLPASLSEGSTALWVGNFDNAYYSGTLTTGTASELRAAIGNAANWTKTDAGPVAQSNWQGSLTVIAVPEPGHYAMLLAGLGMLGLVARRRVA